MRSTSLQLLRIRSLPALLLSFLLLVAAITLLLAMPGLAASGATEQTTAAGGPLIQFVAGSAFGDGGLLHSFSPRPLLIALLLLLLSPLAFYIGYRIGREQGDPR